MIVKAFSFHETTNWGLKCPFNYNVDNWSFLSFNSCLSLLAVSWKSEVKKKTKYLIMIITRIKPSNLWFRWRLMAFTQMFLCLLQRWNLEAASLNNLCTITLHWNGGKSVERPGSRSEIILQYSIMTSVSIQLQLEVLTRGDDTCVN